MHAMYTPRTGIELTLVLCTHLYGLQAQEYQALDLFAGFLMAIL